MQSLYVNIATNIQNIIIQLYSKIPYNRNHNCFELAFEQLHAKIYRQINTHNWWSKTNTNSNFVRIDFKRRFVTMKLETVQQLLEWHNHNKEKKLEGRYITLEMIEPILKSLPSPFKVQHLGKSFQDRSIYKISIGNGPIKVLVWSQMHGNESTGTKAIFDLFQLFALETHQLTGFTRKILKQCTLICIPMLNPDGAKAYTRVNAQEIDLNRDAVALKAKESQLLNTLLKEIHPQFCFNLHDQRTIFSVGMQRLPATISFLAPSENIEREITEGRKITMSVIAAIYKTIKKQLPNQIGRYTDEFYPTATGDNFQKAGHHTILIEAGHYKDDYQREIVRYFNFLALVSGLYYIANGVTNKDYNLYFEIPNNEKQHLDIIYKNVTLSDTEKNIDIGILFKEELINSKIVFTPTLANKGNLSTFTANTYIDLKGKAVVLTELLKN